MGMVKCNVPFSSDRSNREKWSTSKGGAVFRNFCRLNRANPFNSRQKFSEIVVEWITLSFFVSTTKGGRVEKPFRKISKKIDVQIKLHFNILFC